MLTNAQLQTLKAAVLANPTAAAYRTAGDAYSLKAWCNAAGSVSVWRTEAPVTAVYDAIDWTKFTPSGAMDDATLADATIAARRQAQLLAIQTKQMNLQNMLQGRTTIDASKVNIRAGLRDAVIQLPAGAGGAGVAAGGTNGSTVLTALTRMATNTEGALVAASQGSDTTGAVTARILTFEGQVDDSDVNWLINN